MAGGPFRRRAIAPAEDGRSPMRRMQADWAIPTRPMLAMGLSSRGDSAPPSPHTYDAVSIKYYTALYSTAELIWKSAQMPMLTTPPHRPKIR